MRARARRCAYGALVCRLHMALRPRFPGDDIPIVRGSALAALKGENPKIGRDAIMELMDAVDSYFVDPTRPLDRPFAMPVEDVFSIQARCICCSAERVPLGCQADTVPASVPDVELVIRHILFSTQWGHHRVRRDAARW